MLRVDVLGLKTYHSLAVRGSSSSEQPSVVCLEGRAPRRERNTDNGIARLQIVLGKASSASMKPEMEEVTVRERESPTTWGPGDDANT
jgi:hypothetical protein